jgi:hypothetical protein
VCEDRIDFQNCDIISSISSNMCDHFGSLQFEKYWSQRGCKVMVFHLFIYIKGNVCNTPGEGAVGMVVFMYVCKYGCVNVCMYVCMHGDSVCMYVKYVQLFICTCKCSMYVYIHVCMLCI